LLRFFSWFVFSAAVTAAAFPGLMPVVFLSISSLDFVAVAY